jgi:hypothetical protein
MNVFNKVEKELLESILQDAINSDDYERYSPVIKNIYYKLDLK